MNEKQKEKMYDLIPPKILSLIKFGFGRYEIMKKTGLKEDEVRRFCWLAKYIDNIDVEYPRIESDTIESEGARVLVVDIETAPMALYGWHLRPKFIPPEMIISNWYILSWSAKWLFDKETMSNKLDSLEAETGDDIDLVEDLHGLFNEADIIIAHHGKHFDIPRIQERIIYHSLPPITPFRVIDTCAESKKVFSLPSYKLDYMGEYLGLGKKIKTSFDLWRGCMGGDSDSLKQMEEYNRRDVELLEQVYLKLRCYMKNHPNMGVFISGLDSVCPICTSERVWEDGGGYTTNQSYFPIYRCKECGAIARGRHSILTKEKRENLLVSPAR